MADITFQIPDAPDAEVVIRRGFWTGPKILMDGRPLSRARGRRGPYLLPLADGTTREISVRGTLNQSVVVDGHTYPLERRLRPYEYLLVGLPLVLAIPGITGGALGVGLGIGGALANARLARSAAGGPLRILSMVGLTVCLIGVYLAVVVAASALLGRNQGTSVPTFKVGDCYDGVAIATSTDSWRAVDCAGPHDAEIIGNPVYPGASATSVYPGEPSLDAFANTACAEAFATYVLRPFATADEGIIYFTPSSDSWAAGHRTVTCLAVAPAGQRLTGSLSASGSPSVTP